MSYRKEIPCPHCGFDASWYKKDVKIARRLVKEFWDKQEDVKLQKLSVKSEINETETTYDEYIPSDQSNESTNAYL